MIQMPNRYVIEVERNLDDGQFYVQYREWFPLAMRDDAEITRAIITAAMEAAGVDSVDMTEDDDQVCLTMKASGSRAHVTTLMLGELLGQMACALGWEETIDHLKTVTESESVSLMMKHMARDAHPAPFIPAGAMGLRLVVADLDPPPPE